MSSASRGLKVRDRMFSIPFEMRGDDLPKLCRTAGSWP
jgi:hypothetical protein